MTTTPATWIPPIISPRGRGLEQQLAENRIGRTPLSLLFLLDDTPWHNVEQTSIPLAVWAALVYYGPEAVPWVVDLWWQIPANLRPRTRVGAPRRGKGVVVASLGPRRMGGARGGFEVVRSMALAAVAIDGGSGLD